MHPSRSVSISLLRTAIVSLCVLGFGRLAAADAPAKPTIFVLGDSTARNTAKGKNGEQCAGWGTPLADYFDAEKKQKGKYQFEMQVNYWNTYSMETKTFDTEIVSENEFEKLDLAPPEPLTGRAVGQKSGSSITGILFWILLGMVIMGIAGFVLYRYKNRNKYEGGDEAL